MKDSDVLLIALSKVFARIWKLSIITFYSKTELSSDSLLSEYKSCLHGANFQYSFKYPFENAESTKDTLNVALEENLPEFNEETLKNGYWLFPYTSVNQIKVKMRLDSKIFLYTFESDRIDVLEVYQVGTKTFENNVGYINISSATFYESQADYWERRKNLQGSRIKVTTKDLFDFHYLGTNGNYQGPFWDIFYVLQQQTNFSIELVENSDGQWGVLSEDNETWTGMVGMLQKREVDVAVVSLAFKSERLDVMDFSDPILKDKITLLSLNHRKRDLNLMAYIDMFTANSWIFIGIVFICLVLFLHALFRWQTPNREKLTILRVMVVIALAFIQRGEDESVVMPSRARRMAYFTIVMFATFLFASYSALLTSSMIFSTDSASISTFQDLIDRNYKLVMLGGTQQHNQFLNAERGSYFHTVKEKLLDKNPK